MPGIPSFKEGVPYVTGSVEKQEKLQNREEKKERDSNGQEGSGVEGQPRQGGARNRVSNADW